MAWVSVAVGACGCAGAAPQDPSAPPPRSASGERGGSTNDAPPTSGEYSRQDARPTDPEVLAGDEAFDAGELDAAESHYRAARRRSPHAASPVVGLVRVQAERWELPLEYASLPDDARVLSLVEQLERALDAEPSHVGALTELGRWQLVLGLPAEALGVLGRASRIAPNDAEVRSTHGIALLATGHREKAVEELTLASRLEPNDPERLINAGTALMTVGRAEKAADAFQGAVRLAPDDARARSDLGTALLALDRTSEALRHLERAVELEPTRATYLSNLGFAQQRSGDAARAEATLRRALEHDATLSSAWLNLAVVLVDLQRLGEARDAIARARELDPTDPRVRALAGDLAEIEAERGARPSPRGTE